MTTLVGLLFAIGCRTAIPPTPEPVGTFTVDEPKNYLIVHTGTASQFGQARCFEFASVEDLSAPMVRQRLVAVLAERLPQLTPCKDEWPRLVIEYRAGHGVSLHHADPDRALPYSAFAFIALQKSAATRSTKDEADALAEWQYWRGGSTTLVMQQLVFDLTNLYINGLVKPVVFGPRS
jgi:hypothetical protein